MPKYSADEIANKISQFSNWYQTIEVAPGIFTPGRRNCQEILNMLDLPTDCSGLRVLDIGASDGFFSIALEKRGASEITAIDRLDSEKSGFPILKEIFDSKVNYVNESVYNISSERYGKFDIVLCLGVFYHLRHPLLALERIREVTKDLLYLESFAIDNRFVTRNGSTPLSGISQDLLTVPIMQFYPRNELDNDYSNWWGPNTACLRDMLASTNFTVIWKKTVGDRVVFKCKTNSDLVTEFWWKNYG